MEELNQSQSVGTCIVIGLSFCFCFRLRQSGFSDRKQSWKKWKRSDSYDFTYDSNFRFSIGHKCCYDSAYDSKYESVASENQPLQLRTLLHLGITVKIGH